MKKIRACDTKVNCWEYQECGREPGGKNSEELGVCPAATEKRTDGVNNGLNGGRICWLVAGTLCKGQQQGTFVEKVKNCKNCPFFHHVFREEGRNFVLASEVIDLLTDD